MQADFRSILASDANVSALVAERITWGGRPQRDGLPAIVLTVISDVPTYSNDGDGDLNFHRVQADVYGSSYASARTAANAVNAALTGYQATVGGTNFRAIFKDGDRDMTEAGENRPEIFNRITLDFLVHTKVGPSDVVVTPPAQSGPATLSVTPAARWHASASTTATSNGRVTSATDIQGLAGVTEGATGAGPRALTDANGDAFWRFEGSEYLTVANTLSLSSRDMSLFLVGRVHRTSAQNEMFSLGSEANGNPANTLGAAFGTETPFSRAAPTLYGFREWAARDATNGRWLVPGAQLQVLGMVSRASANGGIRLWINERFADPGTLGGDVFNVASAEIGRDANNPGAAGTWAELDLYELVVFDRGLTNAEGATIASELQAAYSIATIDSQLVLDGDSITQGTGDVLSGDTSAAVLGEPGTNRIPANYRVINVAQSGSQVTDLVERRDYAAWPAWIDQALPGENVLGVEIGRNDLAQAGIDPATHAANVAAYLNTPADGVLQAGWRVRLMSNIATGSSALQAEIETWRATMRTPAFLTSCNAGPGDTYDGQLTIVETDQIQVDGATIFEDNTDAQNSTYYQDTTHPSVVGSVARVTGGDTPENGVANSLP